MLCPHAGVCTEGILLQSVCEAFELRRMNLFHHWYEGVIIVVDLMALHALTFVGDFDTTSPTRGALRLPKVFFLIGT